MLNVLIKRENVIFFLFNAIALTIANYMTFTSQVNFDVSVYINFARRMLMGDKMYEDMLDVNFPIIYEWRIPVIWIADRLGYSYLEVCSLYDSFWFLIANLLSFKILKSYVKDSGNLLTLSLTITYVTFVLPVQFESWPQYGQKCHYFVVFLIPYSCWVLPKFFSSIHIDCNKNWFIPVYLLALFAVAIKPIYVLYIIGIEIARAVYLRKLWPSNEAIALGLGYIGYMVFFYFQHPTYFELIPYFTFYRYFADPYDNLIPSVIFYAIFVFAPLLAVALSPLKKYTLLVFFLTLSLFAIAALQFKAVSFRYYMPMSLSLVVAIYCYREIIKEKRNLWTHQLKLFFCTLLTLPYIVFTLYVFSANISYNRLKTEAIHDLESIHRITHLYKPKSLYILSEFFINHLMTPNMHPTYSRYYADNTVEMPYKFHHQWLFTGIHNYEFYHGPDNRSAKAKAFLFDAVYEDLRKEPEILLVHSPVHLFRHDNRYINFIRYYSQDARLEKILQKYQLIDYIYSDGLVDYKVFKKKAP